ESLIAHHKIKDLAGICEERSGPLNLGTPLPLSNHAPRPLLRPLSLDHICCHYSTSHPCMAAWVMRWGNGWEDATDDEQIAPLGGQFPYQDRNGLSPGPEQDRLCVLPAIHT